MKNLLSLGLIFLISCSQTPVKVEVPKSGLEAMLSPEEFRIHRCLHSSGDLSTERKKECLTGTSYEGFIGRLPSNGDDELIMKNNWFFSEPGRLEEFYSITRGFVKAGERMVKSAVNDRGVAFEGSAFFGFGKGWLAELINHHHQIGLFCAPFVTARTDIGVEAGIVAVESLSCENNAAYEGGFLNISAGVSAEATGAPVDLTLSYSFGVNLESFARKIREARAQRHLDVPTLARELVTLSRLDIRRTLSENNNSKMAMLNLALRPLSVLGLRPPGLSTVRQMKDVVQRALILNRSLAVQFKAHYQSKISPYLRANGMPQLDFFMKMLTDSMTGCDSVGGAASLSLSLSPVSVGVTYENYQLLFEMPFEDLRVFKAVTPLLLLNPFLMQPEDLRATVRVARGVLAIPGKVSRQCGTVFPRI